MESLKIDKLPDRTPVKFSISVTPDLKQTLEDYAAAYEAAYGSAEQVADLIPHMLEAFLLSDRAFARQRKRP